MVYKSLSGPAPDNLCQIFSRLSDVHNRVIRNAILGISLVRKAYGKTSLLSVELMEQP